MSGFHTFQPFQHELIHQTDGSMQKVVPCSCCTSLHAQPSEMCASMSLTQLLHADVKTATMRCMTRAACIGGTERHQMHCTHDIQNL